jgi:hypothetical protein
MLNWARPEHARPDPTRLAGIAGFTALRRRAGQPAAGCGQRSRTPAGHIASAVARVEEVGVTDLG